MYRLNLLPKLKQFKLKQLTWQLDDHFQGESWATRTLSAKVTAEETEEPCLVL